MSCPACEQNRQAGKRYCTKCGALLVAEPVQQPRSQCSSDMERPQQSYETPEPSYDYDPTMPLETAIEPKSGKGNKTLVAVLAVIAAVAVLAAVLFATGVIQLGGDGGSSKSPAAVETEEPSDAPETEEPSAAPEAADESHVLYDAAEYAISVRSVEETEDGISMLFSLENRSDEILTFDLTADGVDGYQLMIYLDEMIEEVEPGDVRNARLEIDDADVVEFGIESYGVVDIDVDVHNKDYDHLLQDVVLVSVNGARKDGYTPPERIAFENEQILCDESGVLVTMGNPRAAGDSDAIYISLYLENNTDAVVELDLRDYQLNGTDYSDLDMMVIQPHGRGYGRIWIPGYQLRDLGLSVSDVREFSCKLEIQEWENYDTLFDQRITYAFTL